VKVTFRVSTTFQSAHKNFPKLSAGRTLFFTYVGRETL
jgi:hypothetical protein